MFILYSDFFNYYLMSFFCPRIPPSIPNYIYFLCLLKFLLIVTSMKVWDDSDFHWWPWLYCQVSVRYFVESQLGFVWNIFSHRTIVTLILSKIFSFYVLGFWIEDIIFKPWWSENSVVSSSRSSRLLERQFILSQPIRYWFFS